MPCDNDYYTTKENHKDVLSVSLEKKKDESNG